MIRTVTLKKTLTATAGTALALTMTAGAAQAQSVTIGYTNWADAEAVTYLTERLLEDRMGVDVTLQNADIGLQYQAVSSGDIDFMMMTWLPGTHGTYMEERADDLASSAITLVGPLYTGARLGWAAANLPDSVQSIEDLMDDEIRDMLGGQIHGIGEGAGLTEATYQAIDEYGMDGYEQVVSSEAGMLSALDRATRNDDPIVVTTWSPHWMHGAYEVRYLEDPMGALGGAERVYAAVRAGLQDDAPEVFNYLSRFYIPIDDLEAMMADAEETSVEDAIDNYIADNEARVNYWVTGEIN